MKYACLPRAKNSSDFVIVGSKTGFFAMVFMAAALAILAAAVIIIKVTKNKK